MRSVEHKKENISDSVTTSCTKKVLIFTLISARHDFLIPDVPILISTGLHEDYLSLVPTVFNILYFSDHGLRVFSCAVSTVIDKRPQR